VVQSAVEVTRDADRYNWLAKFMQGALPVARTYPSRTRRGAFKICSALFALLYSFLLGAVSGLIGTDGSTWNDPIHRVHHTGSTIFIGIIVVGLLAQLRAPEHNVAAFQQVVAGILAILSANLIVGDPDNYGGNVGIIDPAILIFLVPVIVLVVLHPARARLFHRGLGMSHALVGIALVAAIPLAIYGVEQALAQRNSWPPTADPHHPKWWMMATLAFGISFVGLLASLRTAGWHIAGWSAGMAAVLFGLISMLYPEQASSVGRMWGSISVLGGAAFIGAVVWEAGRLRAVPTLPHWLRNAEEGTRS